MPDATKKPPNPTIKPLRCPHCGRIVRFWHMKEFDEGMIHLECPRCIGIAVLAYGEE